MGYPLTVIGHQQAHCWQQNAHVFFSVKDSRYTFMNKRHILKQPIRSCEILSHSDLTHCGLVTVIWWPKGCFTNISQALQHNLTKIYNARNDIYAENFELKLCTCAQKHGFGHRYKVSAWNSHKYHFSNIQISREYFGEFTKCQWNIPPDLG